MGDFHKLHLFGCWSLILVAQHLFSLKLEIHRVQIKVWSNWFNQDPDENHRLESWQDVGYTACQGTLCYCNRACGSNVAPSLHRAPPTPPSVQTARVASVQSRCEGWNTASSAHWPARSSGEPEAAARNFQRCALLQTCRRRMRRARRGVFLEAEASGRKIWHRCNSSVISPQKALGSASRGKPTVPGSQRRRAQDAVRRWAVGSAELQLPAPREASLCSESFPVLGQYFQPRSCPLSGANALLCFLSPGSRAGCSGGGRKAETHSLWMRSLTNHSAALLSDMHLSADKLRIPSLCSASPLVCLSAVG